MIVVLATKNEHKLGEIHAVPAAADFDLKPISEFDGAPDVEENGASCEENAAIKAVRYSLWLKRQHNLEHPVIAEDSGLMVEALLDWPGEESARIAPTPAERIELVLKELEDKVSRSAHFTAFTALAVNGHLIRTWRGAAAGSIADAPRGDNGFGYDPIFIDAKLGLTFAELTPAEKTARSHRTKAWTKAFEHLQEHGVF